MPSGKFYTVWTTNQTEKDLERDSMFCQKAVKELNTIECYLTEGDDDYCDLFIEQQREKING